MTPRHRDGLRPGRRSGSGWQCVGTEDGQQLGAKRCRVAPLVIIVGSCSAFAGGSGSSRLAQEYDFEAIDVSFLFNEQRPERLPAAL